MYITFTLPPNGDASHDSSTSECFTPVLHGKNLLQKQALDTIDRPTSTVKQSPGRSIDGVSSHALQNKLKVTYSLASVPAPFSTVLPFVALLQVRQGGATMLFMLSS
ncbi:hypothetical protein Bca52824_002468 [Brassica carinata]|uniref:Uncharacterized protein n=1 Tax=Brassica carinata TaxID=52824 RepID=A0A8X7WNF1_BRACI|nr:hypothetical protein Bca52824_002468 [Brassica carinata]